MDWLRKRAAYNLEQYKDSQGEVNLGEVGRMVLKEAKLKPIYVAETDKKEQFAEMRAKLNSEPGLIICNHPGEFDIWFILNVLNRKDVKIVTSADNYRSLSARFGDKLFIKVPEDHTEAFEFLKTIRKQVEAGGLVVLFPSGGGNERDPDTGELSFKSGLPVVLKRCLKPTNMVYSFNISVDDIQPIINDTPSRMRGVESSVTFNPSLNINNMRKERSIRIWEDYSQAESWQKVASSDVGEQQYRSKNRRNERLADYFISRFSDSGIHDIDKK